MAEEEVKIKINSYLCSYLYQHHLIIIGGSGIDGAGGGSGSSFINQTMIYQSTKFHNSANVNTIYTTIINENNITIAWNLNWIDTFWGIPIQFHIEMTNNSNSIEFEYIGTIVSHMNQIVNKTNLIEAAYTIMNLNPSSYYSFRVIPVFLNGRGVPSNILIVKTLDSLEIYWEPIISRITGPSKVNDPVVPSGRRGHTLSLIDHIIYMFGGRTDG